MLRFIAKTVLTLMLAAGFLWTPVARAQDLSYQASIPFAFYIGDTLFPAGTYHIKKVTLGAQKMLSYRNERGVTVAYQMVLAKELAPSATTGLLTFNQYGGSYFLREFSAPDQGSEPHMASRCARGTLESSAAKKFLALHNQEVALNAIPRR